MSLLPDFPSSPTNGQVATVGDYSYTYNSTTDSWEGVLGGSSGSGTFAQVFTSSGTFTVPTGVTAVKVTVIGGGGGGMSWGPDYSGGGGGGGVAVKYITSLTPGSSISVTVGVAGTGGTYPTNSGATSGGTSSFGTYCSATGGSAGGGTYPNTGGAGGTGTNGDINITGGRGGTGGNATDGSQFIAIGGAGGGSSGQHGQSGLTGYTPVNAGYQPIFTVGGAGYLGGMGGWTQCYLHVSPSPLSGNAGTGYGNGGGGGVSGPADGGAGSPGVVLVEWSASVLVVNTTTGGGIGYDQSWTDVSGSRTFGVSYTNSTTKPIQILVGASTTGAGGGVALTINGVALPGSFAYSPSVTVFSATAIVPVGATYAASAYGGASYASWHELR
jgi:hypothetical protein